MVEYWVANVESLRSTALKGLPKPRSRTVTSNDSTECRSMQMLKRTTITINERLKISIRCVRACVRACVDEAHFWLNGYVNKQNCRIWSEANPQVYVETPLHPEKLTVWCALWAGGILLQKR
ncbi:hypothetical protein TNCV_2320801 [Trichonephila clavipes]|nr:hypothetical protein TNCV_2320801 [Trichonephila clavipes]